MCFCISCQCSRVFIARCSEGLTTGRSKTTTEHSATYESPTDQRYHKMSSWTEMPLDILCEPWTPLSETEHKNTWWLTFPPSYPYRDHVNEKVNKRRVPGMYERVIGKYRPIFKLTLVLLGLEQWVFIQKQTYQWNYTPSKILFIPLLPASLHGAKIKSLTPSVHKCKVWEDPLPWPEVMMEGECLGWIFLPVVPLKLIQCDWHMVSKIQFWPHERWQMKKSKKS